MPSDFYKVSDCYIQGDSLYLLESVAIGIGFTDRKQYSVVPTSYIKTASRTDYKITLYDSRSNAISLTGTPEEIVDFASKLQSAMPALRVDYFQNSQEPADSVSSHTNRGTDSDDAIVTKAKSKIREIISRFEKADEKIELSLLKSFPGTLCFGFDIKEPRTFNDGFFSDTLAPDDVIFYWTNSGSMVIRKSDILDGLDESKPLDTQGFEVYRE